jgi:hypothetical protein
MGATWAEAGGFWAFTLERIIWQLTLSGNRFIVQGILEGSRHMQGVLEGMVKRTMRGEHEEVIIALAIYCPPSPHWM